MEAALHPVRQLASLHHCLSEVQRPKRSGKKTGPATTPSIVLGLLTGDALAHRDFLGAEGLNDKAGPQ